MAVPQSRIQEIRIEIKKETALHNCFIAHTRKIEIMEMPSYSKDKDFVKFVRKNDKVVDEYRKNKKKVLELLASKFPKLNIDKVDQELAEKAKHLEEYENIKRIPAKKKPSQRFWQLVEQTADLVDRVYSESRANVSHDMILETEAEARIVMELIQEFSRRAYDGIIDEKFMEAFHGPEIHVWGKGPRIPHFNAGVGRKLQNIHLFVNKEKKQRSKNKIRSN